MTAAELIAKLQELPPDTTMFAYAGDEYGYDEPDFIYNPYENEVLL